MAQERVATSDNRYFTRGELLSLVGLAWTLSAAVAWTITGEALAVGSAAGAIAVAALAYEGMIGAPLAVGPLLGLSPVERAKRAGMTSALAGVTGAAAFAACSVGTPSPPGTVVIGPLAVALAAYAFVQLAVAAGRWYASALVLWLAAPPFCFYLLLEMARLPADSARWLLYLSPASAAVVGFGGGDAWPGLLVMALAGAALTTLPAEES